MAKISKTSKKLSRYEEIEKNLPELVLTDEEKLDREFRFARIQRARDERDKAFKEFNDQTYPQYYWSNYDAANAYIAPIENSTDVNIVTGTTQSKSRSLLSVLLSFNYNLDIKAYDHTNMPQIDFARNLESVVRKTKNIEEDKERRRLRWKEALDQGDAFVQECFVEERYTDKKIIGEFTGQFDIKWKEKKSKTLSRAETKTIPGINFYPGNVYTFFMEKQPFISYVDLMTYEEAQAKFGEWDRFQYVSPLYRPINEDTGFRIGSGQILNLVETDGWCEIVKYEDKWTNTFQITINGVDMLPKGFPLTYFSPDGEYTITKIAANPISENFFFSKSIPSDTKVLQAVMDEFMKVMVWKAQYSAKPSVANNSNRVVSEKLWKPGASIDKIDAEKIKTIFPNVMITQADFAFMDFMKKMVDENSYSSILQGLSTKGGQTATESLQLQKQSMNMIGTTLIGIICGENRLYRKRAYTILDKYTNKEGQEIDGIMKEFYRKFVMEDTIEDGRQGMKIMDFDEEKAKQPSEYTMVEENIMSDIYQKPVRLHYISPRLWKQALNWNLEFTTIPEPEQTSELNKVMVTQLFAQLLQMAPQKINIDYALERILTLNEEDPSKWINPAQPAMDPMAAMAMGGEMQDNTQGSQMLQTLRTQSPSANTLQSQA